MSSTTVTDVDLMTAYITHGGSWNEPTAWEEAAGMGYYSTYDGTIKLTEEAMKKVIAADEKYYKELLTYDGSIEFVRHQQLLKIHLYGKLHNFDDFIKYLSLYKDIEGTDFITWEGEDGGRSVILITYRNMANGELRDVDEHPMYDVIEQWFENSKKSAVLKDIGDVSLIKDMLETIRDMEDKIDSREYKKAKKEVCDKLIKFINELHNEKKEGNHERR